MDHLDADAIRVPGAGVQVLGRCTSTNSLLLERAPGHAELLAANEQSAGRGRRGRRWHSPAGAGVLFSLALPLGRPVRELAGLSIVAGLAAVRALRALGATQVGLRWPNDLVAGGAKLGGILVETRAQGAGCLAVVGVGINHRAVPGLGARLWRRVAALEQLLRPLPERNAVVAAIGRELLAALRAFDATGFEAFRADWPAIDAYAGRRLRVRLQDGRTVAGTAAGLAPDGALQLSTSRGLRTVRNGRVVSAA
ncbi:MAG: biotin--[acetyl-CoA-carboxylase] ligase [Betaproteobacteria bacterium]|nr:biotin--[acetyl-CoA-carboxylase] ligase [Betaproteobacteria bacterium]MDH5219779.1 biotin--[acetyl-CoA-carboxylase] ligase [Betaproteobacteria bacterium]MDH5351252.1 biotin--[acetyl-CoA-carboxylase] ligase [Betaproteobacteria bacterium]